MKNKPIISKSGFVAAVQVYSSCKGINGREFARKFHIAPSSFSKWINRQAEPSQKTIDRIYPILEKGLEGLVLIVMPYWLCDYERKEIVTLIASSLRRQIENGQRNFFSPYHNLDVTLGLLFREMLSPGGETNTRR